jgi:hypothetical protein
MYNSSCPFPTDSQMNIYDVLVAIGILNIFLTTSSFSVLNYYNFVLELNGLL